MSFIRKLQFSMTVYNQHEPVLFTPLQTLPASQSHGQPTRLSSPRSLIGIIQRWTRKKNTAKMEMPDFFKKKKNRHLYIFYLWFSFTYTHDLHIIPSNEITITETSSWYRRLSPCGISSSSWKSIPEVCQSKKATYIKLKSLPKLVII